MKLNQLLSWFESLRSWEGLSPSSQGVYRILIRQGVEALGPDKDVQEIHAPEADSLYTHLCKTKTLHKAVSVCVVLRKVWNDLIRYEYVTHNPFTKMGMSHTSSRTVLWSEDQIDSFIEQSAIYGLPSIGLLVLLCYTFGQRVGDMRLLKWTSYDGQFLRFVQQKTKKEMTLYVPETMREVLSLVDKVGPYVVTREDTGNPYTEDDYLPIFKQIRANAGLPNTLQIRDTRKSAISEASANGATDSDLMNLGGHDSRKTLSIYQVTTEKAAKRAMNIRFGT